MFIKTEHSTQRLLLMPLTQGEDDFIMELLNSPGWLAFIGDRHVHTQEDARLYIQKILERTDLFYWVVKLKDEQTPIGVITFIQRSYLPYPDLGFAFLPAYTHRGYATEAASTVLNELFNSGNYTQILATTLPANIDSIRLLTKLGFQFSRELKHEKEILYLYGKANDIHPNGSSYST